VATVRHSACHNAVPNTLHTPVVLKHSRFNLTVNKHNTQLHNIAVAVAWRCCCWCCQSSYSDTPPRPTRSTRLAAPLWCLTTLTLYTTCATHCQKRTPMHLLRDPRISIPALRSVSSPPPTGAGSSRRDLNFTNSVTCMEDFSFCSSLTSACGCLESASSSFHAACRRQTRQSLQSLEAATLASRSSWAFSDCTTAVRGLSACLWPLPDCHLLASLIPHARLTLTEL